jgi:hypothetical protein
MGMLALMVNLGFERETIRIWKFELFARQLIVSAIVIAEEFSQILSAGGLLITGICCLILREFFIFGEIARIICRKNS